VTDELILLVQYCQCINASPCPLGPITHVQAKAQVEAELKQATAEAKVRHSFDRSNADYKLVKFFRPSTGQAFSEGEKSGDGYSGKCTCIIEAILYLSHPFSDEHKAGIGSARESPFG
jgi:3-dehydroquinate dehydratase